MTQMVESSPKYNFNKNNHPGENGRPVGPENHDTKVDEDIMYEPDMYYFDYQADESPSRRKQDLTSSLLDVAVSANSAPKESPDSDSDGELSQSSQLSQSQYDAYSSSYENEYVQSDYGNDYYEGQGSSDQNRTKTEKMRKFENLGPVWTTEDF